MNSSISKYAMRAKLRMRPRNLITYTFIAFLVVAATFFAACTGGSSSHGKTSSPSGNKAALCKFESDIDTAGKSVTTPEQSLAVLKSFEPRFNEALADASPSIRPEVQTLVDAARQAIRANDVNVASPESVQNQIGTASVQLDSYCGISDPVEPPTN